MHLIVAFAAPPSADARAMASGLATPALDGLLARWAAVQRDAGTPDSLSLPHERAHAGALGMTGADGCLPWAAHQAAIDGIEVGSRAWGLLTPTHWRVGSDGVHLGDPAALALTEGESRTLWAAAVSLFESEGYAMAWGAPLRWYAAHDDLQGLATASLDRVIGRNIEPWLPRQPAAKRMRRLQNEVQMLLHAHPLNEAREGAGALPVNSFWLSGCGALQPMQTMRGHRVQLDDRLRGPVMQGDGAAWRAAWRALDQEAIAPLLAAARRGEPSQLTLCGHHGAVTYEPSRRSAWQRAIDTVARARPGTLQVLESI